MEGPIDEPGDAAVQVLERQDATRRALLSSSDCATMLATDDVGKLVAAVDAAQDALEALDATDTLRVQLTPMLATMTSALQKERTERGERPLMGCKRRDVVDRADITIRPRRASAFDATRALLDIVWRPLTSTERSAKRRCDPEKRESETLDELLTQRLRQWDDEEERMDREYANEVERLERLYPSEETKQLRREQHDREAHAKEWAGVCTLFRRCGLGRLGSNATLDTLRSAGILRPA